jgi:hypothetical protein
LTVLCHTPYIHAHEKLKLKGTGEVILMPLNLSDLVDEETELLKQKEHIEKELAAVRLLIEGKSQRTGTQITIKRSYKAPAYSMSSIVRETIANYQGPEFGTAKIADIIIQNGTRKETDREALRNTTYLILREQIKEGKVTRVNRGDKKNPKWRYTKIGKTEATKN